MGESKHFLPMKAHYFLFNAGTTLIAFLPTYFKQLGFSSVIVGLIYTILPICGMLAKPFFGVIADRYQKQKMLFIIFQGGLVVIYEELVGGKSAVPNALIKILTVIAFFSINLIPTIEKTTEVSFNCNGGASVIKYCQQSDEMLDECSIEQIEMETNNSTFSCDMSCKVEPWMWGVACENWNQQFCGDTNYNKKLNFTTIVTNFEVEGNCIDFLTTKGQLSNGASFPLYCPSNSQTYFKARCTAHCNDTSVNNILRDSAEIPDNEITNYYQFWLIVIFMVISWCGMAVVVSVGDTICFGFLGEKHHLFGNQRLWGAVGWGLFSIISGLLVDEISNGNTTKNYSIIFYFMFALISLNIILSTRLKYVQKSKSKQLLNDIFAIFKSLRVVIFICWCIVVGLGTALIWNFLFWHLEDLASLQDGCDHLTWIKTLQGIALGIQSFGGELPFFFLSGWILKKIGHIHAMSLVLFTFGIRFLLYSVLKNPWLVLPIELMNGITFGIFYATMASYANIISPPGTEATIQGLVGAIFEGVGVSCGSLIGGFMFNRIGGSKTFRIFGVCSLVLFLIHVLVQKYINKSEKEIVHYTNNVDAVQMLTDDEATT